MKKFKKVILLVIGFLFLGIISGYFYIIKAFPKVEPVPDLKISSNPEMLRRGEYLFNSVLGCADCHSTRDYSKYAGPLVEGTLGKGGFEFNEDFGLPGKFYARNITPSDLGNWTDGEIFRAITEGVDKNGNALFPLMPYINFGQMDRDDIYSVIAYLRTLKPLENSIPESKPSFPMNLIMRTIPKKSDFHKKPDESNTVEYGKYLINAAGCNDCHTQQVKGEFLTDKYLAGGQEYILPGNVIVRPANLTPDNETGLGKWTKEQFINKFKEFRKPNFNPQYVKEGDYNTFMPWTFLANMTDSDISAIYDYLRTIKPVSNRVVKFEKKLY